MPAPRTDPRAADLAGSLAQWRRLMAERPGMSPDDVDELSDHLESEIADLQALGLAPDEAFLIAVKRIGAQDEVSREYARVHSERLWRQLVLTDADAGSSPDPSSGRAVSTPGTAARRPDAASSGLALALILGLAAGLAVRLPHAILGDAAGTAFYPHNLGFLVLPLIGYFLVRHWRAAPDDARGIDRIGGAAGVTLLVAVFAATAILVNIFPTHPSGQTFWLTAIHLPIALVVATGVAYLGPRWRLLGAWMDWVRFLGESVLYYILIALGGGALSALVMAIFRAIGVSPTAVEHVLGWVIPVGAGAAVLVCAWLVERKKSVIENMAPVLTAVFTPLMTAALLAFLAVLAVTGSPVTVDRNVLIIFDAVLIAVAAIVLFTVSARSPQRAAPALDWMQFALTLAAIAVDLVMLWAMAGRLGEWGASPNKLAGLGCNILLLVHLSGSAWCYGRICLGRTPSAVGCSRALQRWQCGILPLFGVWALVVAIAFPPLFGWS